MAELYFGYAVNSGTAVPGATSGFIYSVDSAGDGIAYSTDVTTAASPAWDDSGQTAGLMVLVSETSSSPVVFLASSYANWSGSVNRVAAIPVSARSGSR